LLPTLRHWPLCGVIGSNLRPKPLVSARPVFAALPRTAALSIEWLTNWYHCLDNAEFMRRWIETVWSSPSWPASLVRLILSPASWAFRVAAVLRVRMYLAGWFRSERIGVPVVSVGNLRVGGSGKTPLVVRLVEMLQDRGLRPVVVSRGYGAAENGACLVASTRSGPLRPNDPAGSGLAVRVIDAASAYRTPGNAGVADEALFVALRTGVPVVTNPDRVAGARLAQSELGADVVVLDDGFQHSRLSRDFDLVAVSADDARASCLPAGPLREPWSALRRADFVALAATDTKEGIAEPEFDSELHSRVTFVPTALVDSVDSDQGMSPAWLAGKTVIAVAGIARPERFVRLIEQAGGVVRCGLYYGDHYRYGASDIAAIREAAAGADAVVTTEKDLVKLASMWANDTALWALRIEARIDAEEALLKAIGGMSPTT
jgi:tetraacyldisaccharide 4'-kinase